MSRPSRFALAGALAVAGMSFFMPGSQAEPKVEHVDVTIDGFSPAVVDIVEGETVTWKVVDGTAHHIVHDAPAGQTPAFDNDVSPDTGPYSFPAEVAGEYKYHCTIHPAMVGTINVAEATPPPPPSSTTTSTTEEPTTTTTAHKPTTTTTQPPTTTTTSGSSTTQSTAPSTTNTTAAPTSTTAPAGTSTSATTVTTAKKGTAPATKDTKKKDADKKKDGSTTTTAVAEAPSPGSLAEQLPSLPGVLNTGDDDTTPTTSSGKNSFYAQEASDGGDRQGHKAMMAALGIMGILGAAGAVTLWRRRSNRYWAA